MTKLKTLKDVMLLFFPSETTVYTFDQNTCMGIERELKASAIQDIKRIRKTGKLEFDEAHAIYTAKSEAYAVIDYIMWKNNLTEKDLR